jgi:hypothetical protein
MQQRSGRRDTGMKNQETTPCHSRVTSRFLSLVLCLVLCLAGMNLVACSPVWPELAVSVVLPEFPPAWSGADGWDLDWRSLSMTGAVRLSLPGDTLVLFLPRTGSAAIRCRPVFGSFRGHPYGSIWPLDAGTLDSRPEGVLIPDAGGGLAAELAFRLYQGGWDAAGFNLRRFAQEAELRMADPWDGDLAVLAQAVAEGRFRADYLKAVELVPVLVSGLSEDLASDSPWGSAIRPDSYGQAIPAVAPGIHRWFGSAQELVVSVSSDGSAEWILRGEDGRLMQKVLP